ncbi:unnamed protein product [Closterium sp. Yama58-4]|nr:unnamed protein product [Closterium sp. Yama58-4]
MTLRDMWNRFPRRVQELLEEPRGRREGKGRLQEALSQQINLTRAAELVGDTRKDKPGEDNGHVVRLISLQGVGAGDWLHAIPTRADLTFSPGQYALALGFRLGLPLPVTKSCPCQGERGKIGDVSLPNHLLWCGEGKDQTNTHNTLVYAALRMAREADNITLHETTTYSQPVNPKRADLAFTDRESAETWVTDVTITDPVLQRRDTRALKPPGWAAEEAARGKRGLYEGRPDYVGVLGLAVETYGALARDTLRFLRMLGTQAAKKKFRQGRLTAVASKLTAHYRQRWSVMLQRSQANKFLVEVHAVKVTPKAVFNASIALAAERRWEIRAMSDALASPFRRPSFPFPSRSHPPSDALASPFHRPSFPLPSRSLPPGSPRHRFPRPSRALPPPVALASPFRRFSSPLPSPSLPPPIALSSPSHRPRSPCPSRSLPPPIALASPSRRSRFPFPPS